MEKIPLNGNIASLSCYQEIIIEEGETDGEELH